MIGLAETLPCLYAKTRGLATNRSGFPALSPSERGWEVLHVKNRHAVQDLFRISTFTLRALSCIARSCVEQSSTSDSSTFGLQRTSPARSLRLVSASRQHVMRTFPSWTTEHYGNHWKLAHLYSIDNLPCKTDRERQK